VGNPRRIAALTCRRDIEAGVCPPRKEEDEMKTRTTWSLVLTASARRAVPAS
jgi:hypothetical protein